MNTVYQFCSPCNRERSHLFQTNDTISCTKCGKVIRVVCHSSSHTILKDAGFLEQIIAGDGIPNRKASTFKQPVGLLKILNVARV